MGKREIRLKRFIGILENRKFLSINEMAQALGVSNMTVRRDFDILNQRDLVIMKNGILMLNNEHDFQPIRKIYNLDKEMQIKNAVKTSIGRFAASLIRPKDCVIVDTGSTTESIIPNLGADIQISILCYNLNILLPALQNPNIHVSFSSGHYHPKTQMFESPQGIDFIHSIRANKVFVSAAGVHENLGITCTNSYEVPTKQAILQSAAEHILVADSSKFGKVHAAYFCDLSQIDVVVTDKGISDEWIAILQEKGITLHIV